MHMHMLMHMHMHMHTHMHTHTHTTSRAGGAEAVHGRLDVPAGVVRALHATRHTLHVSGSTATAHDNGLAIKVGPCISGMGAAAPRPPEAPSATSGVARVAPIVM